MSFTHVPRAVLCLLVAGLLACSADASRPTEPASDPSAVDPAETSAPVAIGAASASVPAPSADPELGVSVPAAYAKYCVGTLKTERELQRAATSGNWVGRGEKAAIGTTVLLDATNGSYGADYGAFLRLPDGTWAAVIKDADRPFKKDIDFTSSCAPPKPPSSEAGKAVRVLIGKATFFANKELTGKPCALPAGTEVSMPTRYEWLGSGRPVEIGLKEVRASCGWEKAYSNDFHDGELFWK